MKNKSNITGNNNINVQGLKNSTVSTNPKQNMTSNKLWIIIPIFIAFIALIVQVLVGWEQLIPWFNAK